MKMKLTTTLLLLSICSMAQGAGELLKLNTTGVQYCPGFKPFRFNPANDIDLWVAIDSVASATVYLDANQTQPVATLAIDSAFIADKKASFSAFSGDEFEHLAAVGVLTFDASGRIQSVRATLVRRGGLNACYARATITGKRIN